MTISSDDDHDVHFHEDHKVKHTSWLRASVLGANDGIVSTTCLMLGIAASSSLEHIFITGIAALVAGALSMATGEYVSVHSQQDMEQAALAQEKEELKRDFHGELHELTSIYIRRGLDHDLARQVAIQLTRKNALRAHARDELGINSFTRAKPLLAAMSSAASFACGAAIPTVSALIFPEQYSLIGIAGASLFGLAMLGIVSAKAGDAKPLPAACRVTFWSALAMAVTFGIGLLLR